MAWCSDNYQPKTQAQIDAEGYSLMLFDTDEGTERAVAAGLPSLECMRISRSGKWAIWGDYKSLLTYIIDLTAANPTKKVFLSKSNSTYWCVRAMWVDPVTKADYAYALDNYKPSPDYYGNGIYKIPINADGTANTGGAVKVYSTTNIDESVSVSADGTKIGCAVPWPNTKILDVASGTFTDRHAGGFGCQANIAPDNSYRFFHCGSEHTDIDMFPGLTGDWWRVDLNKNLAGLPSGVTTDFAAPRWSNHLQFFTNTYPMGDNGASYVDCPGLCILDKDANWVQTQLLQYMLPNFLLEKFSADFKSVESSILVGSDPRYVQWGGDAWIATGITAGPATTARKALRSNRSSDLPLSRENGFVTVRGWAGRPAVHLADARGRLLRQWNAAGAVSVDTKELGAGVYVISAANGETGFTRRLTIAK